LKKRCFAIILCFLLLTGCWDRRELNEIGLVLAVAVDKDTLTNEFIISCEVARPNVLKKDGGDGGKAPVEIYTAKGSTLLDAVRNISKKLDRKSYFAHNKVIIISEKLAKDGVSPILDVFVRDSEIRLLVWVIIAKDTEARQLLGKHRGLDQIQAFYLNDMIRKQWVTSEVQVLNLLDFYKKLLKNGVNPTTGAMGIVKEFDTADIKLVGSAAFDKDKLIGYLDYTETRGLNWITDKVKGGIINISGIKNKDELIAIEIKRASSKIIPRINDGKISFTIEIDLFGDIGEIQDATDILELELLSKIEKETKRVIEYEVKTVIDKAKNDLHSDIFGFGNTLYKYYPKDWEKIKNNWNTLFNSVSYELKIDVHLRRSGQTLKPFEPKK
jgi:spore germination protein KC